MSCCLSNVHTHTYVNQNPKLEEEWRLCDVRKAKGKSWKENKKYEKLSQ